MDIQGFPIPEPHRELQEHAFLKNQLHLLLQSPLAQIERQRDEVRRLTMPLSLLERTFQQAHQMELLVNPSSPIRYGGRIHHRCACAPEPDCHDIAI